MTLFADSAMSDGLTAYTCSEAVLANVHTPGERFTGEYRTDDTNYREEPGHIFTEIFMALFALSRSLYCRFQLFISYIDRYYRVYGNRDCIRNIYIFKCFIL